MTTGWHRVVPERLVRNRYSRRFVRTRLGRRAARLGPIARLRTSLAQSDSLRRESLRLARREKWVDANDVSSIPDRLDGLVLDPRITTRFVVLTLARSGSTLLSDEIGRRWDDIKSAREMFNPQVREGRSFEALVQKVFGTYTGQRIVGCKVLCGQVTAEELSTLLGLDGMHVIVLRRRNQVRRFVSERIAWKTQQWHVGQAPNVTLDDQRAKLDERVVEIDPHALVREIEKALSFYGDLDDRLDDVPVLTVDYEELTVDVDGQLRLVGEFLGAGTPSVEGPPWLQRTNPEPLDDLVSNLPEVRAELGRAGLGFILDADRIDRTRDGSTPQAPSWWPDAATSDLVGVAFADAGEVSLRWEQWLSNHGAWGLDRSNRRLLGIVGRAARRSGQEFALTRDITRTARRLAASNLAALHALGEIAERLEGRTGFCVVGISSSLVTGRIELGECRTDLIEIRAETLTVAVEQLRSLGWEGPGPGSAERDACVRLFRGSLSLDVRWATNEESVAGRSPLRSGDLESVVTRDGVTVRVLAAPRELARTILDGLAPGSSDRLGWVIDAALVVRNGGSPFEWSAVIADMTDTIEGATLRAGIVELAALAPGLVPPSVQGDVRAVDIRRRHEKAFARSLGRGRA